ncbi:COX assembly mitochondrial protein 2 [Hypsizygus marmoreus]|uniref:COX assembly mitochondrial protein n=1 Tax=Hypsizygus marmoreus TaxID=39966 RepID=A0A369JRZ7_HYPMA|nr:COX assembly mitochondrial protein 2 [Hypsizygus marmoreus]
MHPQLSDKKFLCKDFIQALENCHSSGWARLTGGCNTLKDELNQCLRAERVARSARNRETAKERRAKTEQAWKEFNAES